ncbi:MAG: fibronectin type III domain-containing protein [Chloroflexota bacterium]
MWSAHPTSPNRRPWPGWPNPVHTLLTWPVAQDVDGYAISFRPANTTAYPPFRFVTAARAGNVALTGLDPNQTYLVSMAALNEEGLMSGFSPELIIGPEPDCGRYG